MEDREQKDPNPKDADGHAPEVGDVADAEAESAQPTGVAPDPAPGESALTKDEELEEPSILPPQEIRAVLEALIFASPQPLTSRQIDQVLEGVPKPAWAAALDGIREAYAREGRGLQLVEVAGGYQITTRPEYNDWVRELLDPKVPTRLSVQALETLAVIAYKQPTTLPEVIALRGVKSGGVIKTLLEKRLIRITGRKEVVGRPMLYGTTKQFLLHFGLKDLSELPEIEEFADVLGEEIDVAGLKKAIESPAPASVSLAEDVPDAEAPEEEPEDQVSEDGPERPPSQDGDD
jgi:segregation and condensation protein B